jgi:hypothetical protein
LYSCDICELHRFTRAILTFSPSRTVSINDDHTSSSGSGEIEEQNFGLLAGNFKTYFSLTPATSSLTSRMQPRLDRRKAS